MVKPISPTASTKDLYDATQRVRNLVNSSIIHGRLIEAPAKWSAICAAMDCIEDICGVCDAFTNKPYSDDWRPRLLAIYGILQALFVQQDSTRSLAEALDCSFTDGKWTSEPALRQIRDLRNRSIGHPSDYSRLQKSARPAGHIAQHSISEHGMQIMIVEERATEFKTVSIPLLIEAQVSRLTEIINEIAERMLDMDNKHKEKYKDKILVEHFNCTGYFCEKIGQSIRDGNSQFGLLNLDILQKKASDFVADVRDRYESESAGDVLDYTLEDFEYAISRLRDHFAGGMNRRDAEVFCHYLQDKRRTLENIAREIDSEFCHDAEGNPLPWAPPPPPENVGFQPTKIVLIDSDDDNDDDLDLGEPKAVC